MRLQEAGGAGQRLPRRRAKRTSLLHRTLDHPPAHLSLCSQLSDHLPLPGAHREEQVSVPSSYSQ